MLDRAIGAMKVHLGLMPAARSERPAMKFVPVQPRRVPSQRDAAVEAAYRARQATATAEATEVARKLGQERAQQIREAAVPASTRTAHAILATTARVRGEKFDPAKIAGAPQRQVVATAEMIIAAGKRRRGEA